MNAASRVGGLLIPALLLAGCLEDPSAPAGVTDDPAAQRPMLDGWVLDPALEPVAGANLSIASLNVSATSGADGYYSFAALPTEAPLVVVAEASGFLPLSKSATAVAEETVRLNFTLEPVPVLHPYNEVKEFTGFLACQAVVTAAEEDRRFECGGSDPQNAPAWEFTVGQDTAGVVIEVQWTPGTALARFLNLSVETVGFGDADELLTAVEGESILRAQVNAHQAQRFYSQGGIVRVLLSAGTNVEEEEAAVGAALAFQQSFHVWASVFYVDPPPPTYTVAEE